MQYECYGCDHGKQAGRKQLAIQESAITVEDSLFENHENPNNRHSNIIIGPLYTGNFKNVRNKEIQE